MNFTVYSKDGCPFCDRVKQVLQLGEFNYVEYNWKDFDFSLTYKDYGISDKADMALAKLPDKLFNKKGITALAKKLKQDPKKMIAYAKDAFDWLYKEGIHEAYRPGDMWSKNFDYKGMMKFAMKVNSKTPVEIVQKLVDSMEDVNYHTEAEYLFDVLPKMKQIQKNSRLSPASKVAFAAQVDDVLRKFNKVAKATYASMR